MVLKSIVYLEQMPHIFCTKNLSDNLPKQGQFVFVCNGTCIPVGNGKAFFIPVKSQ